MCQALARRRHYIWLYRTVHSSSSGYVRSAGQRKQGAGLSRKCRRLSCDTERCCVFGKGSDNPAPLAALFLAEGVLQ